MRGTLAVVQVVATLSATLVGIAQPALPQTLAALQPLLGLPTQALADTNPGGASSTTVISGIVFQDFNSNGVMDTSGSTPNLAIDAGVSGVTVSAYAAGSASAVATAATSASGLYTLTGLTSGVQYRVEFSALPSGFYPSNHGTSNATVPSNGTTVQFVNAGSSNVSLGVLKPCDYCQNNPSLVTSLYQSGNPLPAGSEAGSLPALVQWPYEQTGNTAPTSHATADQIGAT